MQTSSNDNSIWEYVHCSVCMVLFLPPNHPDPVPDIPFWLTECGHVVCNNHLMADQSCASCGAKNPSIVPLQRNMSPPVSEWFRPLSDAHESLVMASRIQHNMFVALIRHYRQRYDAAKIMIKQLQTELESLRSQVNSQRYLAASPRLGILEQRDLYENLYSSSSGSASKRRRIDVEGAVSSPHSSSTPNRLTRAFNAWKPFAKSSTQPDKQSVGDENSRKYAFIPPSTPMRGRPTGNAGGQCIPQAPGAQPMSRPQSVAVMPPPTLDPRKMTTRAASASLSRGNIQGSTNVGPSMNTHVGRFGGQPHAVQRRSELELVSKEGGGTPRTFGVRDGRRFIPGMPGTNIVGVHYRVGKKIGEGSFGVIFEGTDLLNSQAVAIKFLAIPTDRNRANQMLLNCVMSIVRIGFWPVAVPGIPQIYHFGQEGLHNILVIDLLGPSLEDLFDMCGRKFSVKTVCMTAKQMLHRVQTIHEKNLIYRDIKPDNFLIGRPGTKTASMVHVVDFGMAKQYRDPKTKQHIPYRERKSLSGTARYMSINTHLGREQSRRDDLESLGHVFMYFLRGGLPWQGLKAATNKQKYEKIGEKKQTTPIKELCEGFPEEFSIYLNYVRRLGFEENPDYDFLRELFTKVLKNAGEPEDGVYDWMLLNGGKGLEATQGGNYQQPSAPRRDTQRRASQQQLGSPAAPSPAMVRHGSKQANRLTPGTPGGGPASAAAQIGVAAPTPSRRASALNTPQHPYASTANAIHTASGDFRGTDSVINPSTADANGQAGVMTPAALDNIHNGFDQHQETPRKKSFLDVICCR
ncbi:kinase-like protein, partial [Rhizoctonia solani]